MCVKSVIFPAIVLLSYSVSFNPLLNGQILHTTYLVYQVSKIIVIVCECTRFCKICLLDLVKTGECMKGLIHFFTSSFRFGKEEVHTGGAA